MRTGLNSGLLHTNDIRQVVKIGGTNDRSSNAFLGKLPSHGYLRHGDTFLRGQLFDAVNDIPPSSYLVFLREPINQTKISNNQDMMSSSSSTNQFCFALCLAWRAASQEGLGQGATRGCFQRQTSTEDRSNERLVKTEIGEDRIP